MLAFVRLTSRVLSSRLVGCGRLLRLGRGFGGRAYLFILLAWSRSDAHQQCARTILQSQAVLAFADERLLIKMSSV